MFEFSGSWQKDAANTQNLAFDGVFITLYSLVLDKSRIVLKDRVRNAVPSSWDPAALAKFIEMYGTHIIVGLKMGGKDVIYLKQQYSSSLKPADLQFRLKDITDKRFSYTLGQNTTDSEQAYLDNKDATAFKFVFAQGGDSLKTVQNEPDVNLSVIPNHVSYEWSSGKWVP